MTGFFVPKKGASVCIMQMPESYSDYVTEDSVNGF